MLPLDFGLGILGSILASGIYSKATCKKMQAQFNDLLAEFSPTAGCHLMVSHEQSRNTPYRDEVYKNLEELSVPSEELLTKALMERWYFVRASISSSERDDFFNLNETQAREQLTKLSTKMWKGLASYPELYGSALKQTEENIINHLESLISTKEFIKLKNHSSTGISTLHNVFPGSEININQIYVSPIAHSINLSDPETEDTITPNVTDYISELLNSQNCVVITGGYGSGKSIILKKLRSVLAHKACPVLFFSGIDWKEYIDDSPSISALNDELMSLQENLYIFIDSIEDFCDFNEADTTSTNFESNFSVFRKLTKNPKIKLILSVRNSFSDRDDMALKMSFLYSNISLPENIKIVYLKGFDSSKKKEWIKKYLNSGGVTSDEETMLKLTKNKKISGITSNPLGLYVLCNSTKEIGEEKINATDYYRNFIAETIKGKFSGESKHGAYFLRKNNLTQEYQKFINDISVILFENSEKMKKSSNVELLYSKEWPIDPNEINYDNSINEAKKITTDFLTKNTTLNLSNERKKHSLLTSLLSCYFFTWKDKSVTLKDDNILHYFLASNLVAHLSSKKLNSSVDILENLKISGTSINYATDLILDLSHDQQAIASENTVKPVKELLFGENQNLDKIELSGKGIRNLISLYTLCLKMNWLSLSAENESLILKAIPQLIWLDEIFKVGYKSLIYRSMYGVKLENQEISNINLDNFNFSHAELNNVKFKNCNLSRVLFNSATLNDVNFSNCTFNQTEFKEANGNTIFTQCFFKKTKLNDIYQLKVKFTYTKLVSCYVDISSTTNKKNFTFKNCDIEDVTFQQKRNKRRLITLKFENCFLKASSIKNSVAEIYSINSLNSDKGFIDHQKTFPLKSDVMAELKYP